MTDTVNAAALVVWDDMVVIFSRVVLVIIISCGRRSVQ